MVPKTSFINLKLHQRGRLQSQINIIIVLVWMETDWLSMFLSSPKA